MKRVLITLACTALVSGAALAADMNMAAPVTDSSAIQWGAAPPALPPGAQMAVMSGDPSKSGFVSIRAKMPAGYVIAPHTHPTEEHATVLSGTAAFGMGDKADPASAQSIGPGGYFIAKTGMHHYMIAKTDVIVQVDMVGPFEITYVNPADDPRNKK